MKSTNRRQEERLINLWVKRLDRRLHERGIKLTYPSYLDQAAHTVALHQLYPHTSKFFLGTDNLPDRITLRQAAAKAKQSLSKLFGRNPPDLVDVDDGPNPDSFYRHDYHQEYAATIPYCTHPHAYDPDSVAVANFEHITQEYKDLFTLGILEENGMGVLVYVDRPHHSPDRIGQLVDDLVRLDNYPVLNDELHSEEERRREQNTVDSEIGWFVRALDMEPSISDVLFGPDLDDWEDKDTQPRPGVITPDLIKAHMWELIAEHDVEFGDDSTYLEITELAPHSPLYRLGQATIKAIDEVREKVETAAIVNPGLSYVFEQIIDDLMRATVHDTTPRPVFYVM